MQSKFNTDYSNQDNQLYSQWGEEGILREALSILGIENGTCCEFGAADGLFCSNTATLWRDGWKAFLFESDPNLFSELNKNVLDYPNVHTANVEVVNIDELVPDSIQVMSIDIDGLDLDVFRKMNVKHDIVVIEHNPTFPPWVYFEGGHLAGSSIKSIVRCAEEKGYVFLTATKTNVILINADYENLFANYNRSLLDNFDYSCLNYVVTDYIGNYDIVGILPYAMVEKVDFEIQT